uniref:Probable RNA-binding protein 18 n=1 Tax=Lepisosteus oculatus TaxID=7918 RepID=W5M579_LEPOC
VPMASRVETLHLENASILSESTSQEGHRLWIGNIDPKITEYEVIKWLYKFGNVEALSSLKSFNGQILKKPAGVLFRNTKNNWEEAERAIQRLNGKLALSKKLVVRWAHAQVKRFDPYRNEKALPISLEPSSSTEESPTTLSVNAKIKAIEAKLQMMENNPDDNYTGPSPYLYNKPTDKKRTAPYHKQTRRYKR